MMAAPAQSPAKNPVWSPAEMNSPWRSPPRNQLEEDSLSAKAAIAPPEIASLTYSPVIHSPSFKKSVSSVKGRGELSPKQLLGSALNPNADPLFENKLSDPARSKDGGGFGGIHSAARRGDVDGLTWALRSCDDHTINTPTKMGLTALHFACESGVVSAVEVLLAAGAKLDVKDKMGRTPLHTACRAPHGASSCIAALIYAGADYTISDIEGKNPREYAEFYCYHEAAQAIKALEKQSKEPAKTTVIPVPRDKVDFVIELTREVETLKSQLEQERVTRIRLERELAERRVGREEEKLQDMLTAERAKSSELEAQVHVLAAKVAELSNINISEEELKEEVSKCRLL